MKYLLLSVLLLVGCTKPVKPEKEPEQRHTVVTRPVVCKVGTVPVPEFQPVNFTTVIVEGVAWIALSPAEHGSLQTNHAKLVGYSRELAAEVRQVQQCIDRHNKDIK